ncbi:MAG: PAS domain S-box protein [Nitrospirae bacterium]|nr:PAS domain S-box protein [Nitrospirota bacterium]
MKQIKKSIKKKQGEAKKTALKESEKKFRSLSESAKDAVILIDSDGNISYWNRAAEDIFGYSAREATGKELHQFLAPEQYREAYKKGSKHFRKTGKGAAIGKTLELSAIRKNGAEFPVELSISAVKLKGKWHAIGIVRDITERKKAEEERRERLAELEKKQMQLQYAKKEWEDTFDSIANPIFIHDREFRLIRVNKAYQRISGKSFGDIIGMPYYEVFPKMKEPFKTCLNPIESTGEKEAEVAVPSIGRIFNARTYPIMDARGNPVYSIHIMEDITEKRAVEKAIEESEQRFRALFDNANDGILLADIENKKFCDGNKMISQMLGYSLEEIKTLGVLDIHPEKDLPYVIDQFERQSRKEFTLAKDIPVKKKDGNVFYADINSSPITLAGKTYLMGIFRDITERKEAQKRLKEYSERLEEMVKERTKELEDANQELQIVNNELELRKREAEELRFQAEVANRAKTDFLANMSHELRTPLNSILGFSEILIDELYGKLNKEQREYIDDIYTSGKHLLGLINDILDLSKVEAGKTELELSRFLLQDALHASITMLKEKAMKHKVEMALEIEPDADIEIEADERRIKQIMFNLLSNAVRYSPEGGAVRVSAKRVKSSELGVQREEEKAAEHFTPNAELSRDFIEISVADTGIGISKEDQQKLFQPFQQVGSYLTKKEEGTGLGLSLCKRFVELHGGKIWVESDTDKGAKFSFTIPIRSD